MKVSVDLYDPFEALDAASGLEDALDIANREMPKLDSVSIQILGHADGAARLVAIQAPTGTSCTVRISTRTSLSSNQPTVQYTDCNASLTISWDGAALKPTQLPLAPVLVALWLKSRGRFESASNSLSARFGWSESYWAALVSQAD